MYKVEHRLNINFSENGPGDENLILKVEPKVEHGGHKNGYG
jgi:hypothetical protein